VVVVNMFKLVLRLVVVVVVVMVSMMLVSMVRRVCFMACLFAQMVQVLMVVTPVILLFHQSIVLDINRVKSSNEIVLGNGPLRL